MASPTRLRRVAGLRARVPKTISPQLTPLPGARKILQCQHFWCWAAVAQEVHRLYQPGVPQPTQCQIAQARFQKKNCRCTGGSADCRKRSDHPCNRRRGIGPSLPGPYRSLDYDDHFGGAEIQQALRAGRPVIAEFHGSIVHYVLVTAITGGPSDWDIEVADPENGTLSWVRFIDHQPIEHSDRSLFHAHFMEKGT